MTDLVRDNLQAALSASFTLGRELGGGGMSRVFLAKDAAFDRDVVVKVLSPELAQALSVERFGREIAMAAALQHANIVPVLSAGTTQDGLPFYLMPFIEGSSLRDLVAGQTQLPIADVLLVLNDVTRALVYAHGRGVVHRDIKPDNVMLSGGAALVTDFGIAKAMNSARASQVSDNLTRVGTSLGSPAYMSPEQGAGDPDTDHRTDLYSLGAMAYELLTGRPPFGDRPAHAQLIAHVVEVPLPVVTLRPDVPEPLAHLVMQCLAKEPSERPQQATEVLERLVDATLAARSGTTGQQSAPNVSPQAMGPPVGARVKSVRGVRLAIAAGLITVAAGLAWIVNDRMRAPAGP
ncbi:MAG: serine/threonine protein kinase, partial [Gemmatimonadaceae bacterium]|nr:serine/threonine protein kinase [Gemmatimonadaceae bacterium]